MEPKTPSLKQIISEYISDEIREMGPEDTREISLAELRLYAWTKGYEGNVLDLMNVEKIDIDNRHGEFEDRVVKPLERLQRIYHHVEPAENAIDALKRIQGFYF